MGVWRDINPDRLLLSLAWIRLKEKRLSSPLGLPASMVTQVPKADLSDRWRDPADRASGLLRCYSRTVAAGVEVQRSSSTCTEVIRFHILIGLIVKLAEQVMEPVCR